MSYQPGSLRGDFLLDPSVTFLNHGSFGATPRPVFESYQRWQRELELDPVDFIGRKANGLLLKSRSVLGEYLHVGTNDLVFVPNATYGMNVIARSISFKPGDEVLTTDHEYGAIEKTWRYIGKREGFQLINHQMTAGPFDSIDEWIERFWQGVTSRTRVIMISHITAPTGLIFPVEAVCRRARQEGILTAIDGAHAPGQIELNLEAMEVDFYTGNLHKWLCAPKGSAFLYAHPDVQAMVEPLVVSHGYDSANPGVSTFIDYLEWTGTRDIAAYLAVVDAVQYFKDHEWVEVRATCHRLAVETMERFAVWSQQPPLSTNDWFSQMVSAPLPVDLDLKKLGEFLWSRKIEVPLIDWNGRKFTRVSVQAYTTQKDLDYLIESIREFADGKLSLSKSHNS